MNNSVRLRGGLEPLVNIGIAHEHCQGPVGMCFLDVNGETGLQPVSDQYLGWIELHTSNQPGRAEKKH